MNKQEAFKIVADYLSPSVPLEKMPKADLIFVHGTNLIEVPMHAAHLYSRGFAPRIVVTGGVSKRTRIPDGYNTEAEYSKDVLMARGVLEEAIIVEDTSANTSENVICGMNEVLCRCIVVRSLIIVTVPPHLRRAIMTFERNFSGIKFLTSAPEIKIDDEAHLKYAKQICKEVDRLQEYTIKGDIASSRIPLRVLEAKRILEGLP